MKYPTYIEYGGKEYPINIDFKIALECLALVSDESVSDTERTIGVITMLFGEEIATNEETLKLAQKFLQCAKDSKQNFNQEIDMDFEQDEALIEASFMSDYGIDLSKEEEMHWWKFCNLVSGLKPDCALNRIREIRNYDIGVIKDEKTRRKILDAKKQVALKLKINQNDQKIIDEFENLFE